MNQLKKKSFWQEKVWFLLAAFVVLVGWASQQVVVQDFWKGVWYQPDVKVGDLRGTLELTGTGQRIFAASAPVMESGAEFNQHCDSHDVDVSLLGCYTNGKIYVYEIELEELKTGNQVTMAHELLHAVWERMSEGEKREVKGWLEDLYEKEREWFDRELEVYAEEERIEEIYTRAGTKLRELPEVAEKHYGKIFQNRMKIVDYYEEYEAPFLELKAEMDGLLTEIEKVRAEVEVGKEKYSSEATALGVKIDEFNRCADRAGCFRTETEFNARRRALLAEKESLENLRNELNERIAVNNERVDRYKELQAGLGRLNDAINSNIELIEKSN